MNGISVRVYSLSKNRNDYCFNSKGQRCKHFQVKEFACKDGSDIVLVSPLLIDVLEEIRESFGKPVNINSGYRTPAYNKKVGGARLLLLGSRLDDSLHYFLPAILVDTELITETC